MKKLSLKVYPKIPREELDFYKRLADAFGLLSIYPLLSIISYSLENILLLLVSETYLFLIAVFLAYILLRREKDREKLLAVIVLIGAILIVAPYFLATLIGQQYPFIGISGKLLSLVGAGLYIHDVSKNLGMRERLNKYGSLVILGTLALIVREPIFILGGLILVALGFGGASNEVRRLYYANIKLANYKDTS